MLTYLAILNMFLEIENSFKRKIHNKNMEELILLVSLNILFLILNYLLIIFIKMPNFIRFLDKRFGLCKKFILTHETPFTVAFIFLFASEQLLLVLYIFLFKENIEFLKLVVSLFSIIVIATASLQATILQTKIRYNKDLENLGRRIISYISKKGKKKRL